VQQAERHGGVLLLASEGQVWAADLSLRGLWELPWPGPSAPRIDCFADGVLYWVAGDCLRCCTPGGHSQALCRLPEDLIAGAMNEHEQATGHSALFAASQMGHRPTFFYWRVGFDADQGRFFVANGLGPHLLLCLEASLAGLPAGRALRGQLRLWRDPVLARRRGERPLPERAPQGGGLATAYTHEVRVLSDGRCLADGGPGVVCYGPQGDRLWVFPRHYLRFHCDPARQFLVGCYWRKEEPAGPSRVCLELARGL
jgi:hypothetical protein